MFSRLSQRWQYLALRQESENYAENANNSDEIIADMLIRAMTREYLDVLKVTLVGGTINVVDRSNPMDDVMVDVEEQSMDGVTPALTRAAQSAMAAEIISELGSRLLKCSVTCNPIVMTVLRLVSFYHQYYKPINFLIILNFYLLNFSVLSWNDSNSSLRATCLIGPIVKYLASEQLLTPNLSTNILIAVLKALQLHGQHDANQVKSELFLYINLK